MPQIGRPRWDAPYVGTVVGVRGPGARGSPARRRPDQSHRRARPGASAEGDRERQRRTTGGLHVGDRRPVGGDRQGVGAADARRGAHPSVPGRDRARRAGDHRRHRARSTPSTRRWPRGSASGGSTSCASGSGTPSTTRWTTCPALAGLTARARSGPARDGLGSRVGAHLGARRGCRRTGVDAGRGSAVRVTSVT